MTIFRTPSALDRIATALERIAVAAELISTRQGIEFEQRQSALVAKRRADLIEAKVREAYADTASAEAFDEIEAFRSVRPGRHRQPETGASRQAHAPAPDQPAADGFDLQASAGAQ